MLNKIIVKIVILLLSVSLLNSCGFTPVYSTVNGFSRDFLSSIELLPIDSFAGVNYYGYMKDLLPPLKVAKYQLTVTLSYSSDYSIIQKNTDALREVVNINVKYKLHSIESNKIIDSGSFSRFSSYDINIFPYDNQNNKKEIQRAMAISIAEEMRNRLILFFENNKNEIF